MKKKVAILSSYLFNTIKEIEGIDRPLVDGASRYLIELCKMLEENDFEVTIVYPIKMTDKLTSPIEKDYFGFRGFAVPLPDGVWELNVCVPLNSVFNELTMNFDLRIYFAPFVAYPQVINPAIVISHGIYWDFPSSIIATGNDVTKKDFLEKQIDGFINASASVSVDTNTKNFLASIGKYTASTKMHYIPNFVDTKKFYPRKTPKDWDKPRILYPRRLVSARGVNEFLIATQQLPEYEFYLCGQPQDDFIDKQLYGNNYPNVKIMYAPFEAMGEIYRNVDLAIIPTKYAEGTSLSCLEAMACGLPVITTPVGGLGNLIIDGYNGLLVDVATEKLAPYIKMLVENPDLMKKFGERNAEIVKDAFTIEHWRAKWLKLINKLI